MEPILVAPIAFVRESIRVTRQERDEEPRGARRVEPRAALRGILVNLASLLGGATARNHVLASRSQRMPDDGTGIMTCSG
jgi:hypothetical protein